VFMSPGLEFNDLGYMRAADYVTHAVWTGYNFTEPFSIFRNLFLNNSAYVNYDFGGTLGGAGYNCNVNASFKNYWNGSFGGGVHANSTSTGILRGGPSMYMPNNWRYNYQLFTDQRKAFSLGFIGNGGWGSEKSQANSSYTLVASLRPMNTLSISLYPTYSAYTTELQYITQRKMNSEDRYLFGNIEQKTLNMSLRINFNITPDLTIQYWGQPFIASGEYSEFKMITDPKAGKFTDRYHIYTDGQISINENTYEIDEDEDMNMDYSFWNPDFTVDEWLSNLVIRWEFLPGSTAYMVWSQTRDYYNPTGVFEVWDNMGMLFSDKKATNTFLLKVSYRFGLR